MPEISIKRALIAVYDKTGIIDFARALVDEFGIEIISTGGTARHLKEAGIPVTLVEDVTGFPEMLDGRVKTLHPKIHAAILADRDNPEHMRQLAEQGITPIDMVVVNLYPFEETVKDPTCKVEDAIEMIDIGGPCLLRAAAKNHRHVVVVEQWQIYDIVLGRMRLFRDENDESGWRDLHESGAFGAFWLTTSYDAQISTWLSATQMADAAPYVRVLRLWSSDRLRYGENPSQSGELFTLFDDPRIGELTAADAVWESEPKMSFNNYVDADSALGLCAELARSRLNAVHAASFIKHTNACGVGIADDVVEAYRQAYLGDPNAAMGGILAVNFEVDPDFAKVVMGSLQRWGKQAGADAFFVEVWVAPAFQEKAVEVIREAKQWGQRVRLLTVGEMGAPPDEDELDYKRIAAGMLVQDRDLVGLNEEQWKVVTDRTPTDREMADLRLAWLVCKHTKSNAISICRDGMLIGNGAGQMSRVMSCRIATWLAKENGHEDKLKGAVAASDAFFPFRDGLDILADAGVTTIIQPGGSKRDEEVIAAANERGLAMIFTGTRHFKH